LSIQGKQQRPQAPVYVVLKHREKLLMFVSMFTLDIDINGIVIMLTCNMMVIYREGQPSCLYCP